MQETGFYSFKWRDYMPDLGRFTAVDPLHWKFPYNSTYAFQENKLGMGRELEGLELFPFEFLLTSNSAIEPAIPLAEAGIKEIPIEEITLTGSKAAPPSPPGFWEKIGNWFDSVFDSSSESSTPRAADKTVENVKPESSSNEIVKNPYGSKGKPDHQQKVQELTEKAKGEAKEGEKVISEKKIGNENSNRRPDVQIQDKNGNTRKIFEAERRPNSSRNKTRESEYDKLGIQHETYGF